MTLRRGATSARVCSSTRFGAGSLAAAVRHFQLADDCSGWLPYARMEPRLGLALCSWQTDGSLVPMEELIDQLPQARDLLDNRAPDALRAALAPAAKKGQLDAFAPLIERALAGVKRNPDDPLCLTTAANALLTPQVRDDDASVGLRLERALKLLERLREGGARSLEVNRRAADALQVAWLIVYQASAEHVGRGLSPTETLRLLDDEARLREASAELGGDERAQLERALELLKRVRALLNHFVVGFAAGFPNSLPAYESESLALYALGRLREIAFRNVGEGTGKALDLDRYDQSYLHLFIWSDQQQEIVGAYRLGLVDELLAQGGMQALYISSLFKISNRLFEQTGPAIELGRSFISPAYQRSYAPLMLLWKGIGTFLVRHPQYHHLIGPVSISNDYKKVSKAMLVRFLSRTPYRSPYTHLVQPRTPFSMRRYGRAGIMQVARMVRDVKELGDVIADIEPDGKNVPILIRQYLSLGARSLAFNVDPDFGHCLDCLCLFDVLHTERKALVKYMGREAADAFRQYHAAGAEVSSV